MLRWFFGNEVKGVGINGGGVLKGGGGEEVGIEEINSHKEEVEEVKDVIGEVVEEVEYYDIEEVRRFNYLLGIAGVFIAASVAWEVL